MRKRLVRSKQGLFEEKRSQLPSRIKNLALEAQLGFNIERYEAKMRRSIYTHHARFQRNRSNESKSHLVNAAATFSLIPGSLLLVEFDISACPPND